MFTYLLENLFWNPSVVKYGVLIGLSHLVFVVFYFVLRILYNRQELTFYEYIPIEQTAFSILVSFWTFGVFCLPFAVIAWMSFFFAYPIIFYKNKAIKAVLKNSSKKYNDILMEKRFKAMAPKTLLGDIIREKKYVKGIYISNGNVPVCNFPSFRIYLSGLVFCFFYLFIEQKSLAESGFIWLVLLENLFVFLGIFYAIYLLLYLIEVKHWLGDWHYNKTAFDLCALLFFLVGVAIVSAITFCC